MSWNVIENDDGTLILLNSSQTLIRFHSQVSRNVAIELMSKMEELEFPHQYTKGLKEIYFTFLKSNLEGDYDNDGAIRIACNKKFKLIHETFIHEVGHHVDALEDVSNDPDLIAEWRLKSGSFFHADMRRDPSEYFAIGFERYHTGGNITSKSHPYLWFKVNEIHNKKSNR